jgi:hypothetical protein
VLVVVFLFQSVPMERREIAKRLMLAVLVACVLAVVPVYAAVGTDPCIHLTPSDPMYWMLGCWGPWAG